MNGTFDILIYAELHLVDYLCVLLVIFIFRALLPVEQHCCRVSRWTEITVLLKKKKFDTNLISQG